MPATTEGLLYAIVSRGVPVISGADGAELLELCLRPARYVLGRPLDVKQCLMHKAIPLNRNPKPKTVNLNAYGQALRHAQG